MKTLYGTTALALGLSAALAAPALAGNPEPAPAPVEVAPVTVLPVSGPDWSGAYAGVHLGYGDVQADDSALDGDGTVYGVHAGYRWDFGRTVAGIEADYGGGEIDLGDEDLDSLARLKGQYGYKFGDALAYATAGVAQADTSVGDETGYVVGLGMDYAVTPSVAVGGEVLYHEFDEFGDSGVGADATTATLRVSYRF